ncbi:MAG: type II toxin-antitoxin system RelE/ParE family toxin [Planctomycetes bacterium]|nr:type II toxin-antitoxin system RelE/ParE family toxin [Planctomycetota bacterium]
MPINIVLPDEVEVGILEIDLWWRRNRPAAPSLFAEEIAATMDLLAREPMAGRRYRHPHMTDTRRLLLRATRYHVYYRIDGDVLTVLAVWSACRGCGPDLGA